MSISSRSCGTSLTHCRGCQMIYVPPLAHTCWVSAMRRGLQMWHHFPRTHVPLRVTLPLLSPTRKHQPEQVPTFTNPFKTKQMLARAAQSAQVPNSLFPPPFTDRLAVLMSRDLHHILRVCWRSCPASVLVNVSSLIGAVQREQKQNRTHSLRLGAAGGGNSFLNNPSVCILGFLRTVWHKHSNNRAEKCTVIMVFVL